MAANVYDTLPGDDDAPTKGNVYDTLPGDDDDAPKIAAPENPSFSNSIPRNRSTIGQALNNAADQAHEAASGAYHSIVGGYKGIGAMVRDRFTGQGDPLNDAADSVNAETAKTYHAPKMDYSNLPGGKEPSEIGGGAFLDTVPQALHLGAEKAADAGHPQLATGLESAIPAMQGAASVAGMRRLAAAPEPMVTTPEPEALPASGGAKQSMGAMLANKDLSVADPELRAAIESTPNPHDVALDRHLDAAQLVLPEGSSPLRLRKGQATGDDQQISDEKNLRADPETQGILSDSINDQNSKLGVSISEIRRQATPDIVQRTNAEHDQAVIDAIKQHDNAMVLDTRAKYKALADANGGAIPIDTGAAINGIESQLGHNYLTETANESSVIRPILSDLRSGAPINFEKFENARTRLAELQRTNTPEGVAAGIVRNSLESLPLPPEAAPLKGLADQARAAAKARFDIIKANPAYDAAINDNVPKKNGLHDVGAPSPLAGSFIDKYATGNSGTATPALVNRLKQAVPDPIIGQSIEAAALNKLRTSAGIDEFGAGNFNNAPFRKTLADMTTKGKAQALLSPESLDRVQRLDRVSGYVNNEGKASTTNRANTMLALNRFGAINAAVPEAAAPSMAKQAIGKVADMGADFAAGHIAGTPGIVAKRMGVDWFRGRRQAKEAAEAKAAKEAADQSVKDAKLKFALDAVKPGAGLDYVPPVRPTEVPNRAPRASGGRVSHDELVDRLVRRWKEAKRDTDAGTKPLLALPDPVVTKALNIAQERL